MGVRFENHLRLDELDAKLLAALPGAVEAGLTVIKDKAVELVPKRTEHLAESAAVHPGVDGGSITFDGPYAAPQHEWLDLHHTHGGQAKYLEEPLHTESENAKEAIARELGGAL